MIEKTPTKVLRAFEMLLDELEAQIDVINAVGARAFEVRNNVQAKKALEQSNALEALRARIVTLREDWQRIVGAAERDGDEKVRTVSSSLGRLPKGMRTPESEYYEPILRVLEEMGGRGEVAEVLERVEERMKPVLKDVDYQPLPSMPSEPRWRNTAQWARNTLSRDGLIKAGSPRGVWEISDEGRAKLKELKSRE